MIKKILDKGRYCFHESFDSWEEAIRASVVPLVVEGIADVNYGEDIINAVKEYGPYIVIAPDVCIPHAKEGKNVSETAISFMKTEKPVQFSDNPEENANLFFVLASTDNEQHLENLMALVDLLDDPAKKDLLMAAKCPEDLRKLID
ncbi:MAG: PTS sugar transporter subunit IIA [Epulopiscium sp. Nele67-Bin002]|nr:MAG: PTS sugar transporter subunit IIA [Epulopiscium sp. Nuni2H_MBin001]OON92200.1 MAG: PTS sugar transporter subunit IIA [Epulopiscium sp. Nele67-Bin002]